MNKLGIGYNVFDGVELLESSVDSIRNVADYVCVVYQTVSNFGNTINADVEDIVMSLKTAGKVDEIYKYEPNQVAGHANEINKRNMGMLLSKIKGCTHFMTMDTDELYDESELMNVRSVVYTGDFDSSACKMLTYYRSGEFIVDPPEEYYVPLIYKIDDRRFSMNSVGARWSVPVDPTRRLPIGSLRLFDRAEIQMHHFSYVRDDIRAKLVNSSASPNYKDRIDEIASHYENWVYGEKCMFAGREKRMYNVKRVDNKFNINDRCR